MPDLDKEWTIAAYALSYVVLEDLKRREWNALPRKGSKKSGKIFYKFMNDDLMAFLKDDSIPVFQKMLRLYDLISVCNDLISTYTFDYGNIQYYHQELATLYTYGLEISESLVELDMTVNSGTKENPS